MQAREEPGATTSKRPFSVGMVRYIKLGEGGKWAAQAIRQGVIPFGYPAVDHRACARRDWTEVRSQLALMGRPKAGVSQALRELKDFYELGDDTLWFTIADGHIWWAFASGPVIGGEERRPQRSGAISSHARRLAQHERSGNPTQRIQSELCFNQNRELPHDDLCGEER